VNGFKRLVAIAGIAGGMAALFVLRMPIAAQQQGTPVGTETREPAHPPVQVGPSSALGAASYVQHCAVCHGDEREGILPGFPPLIGIHHQMSDDKLGELIHTGKGRMPGFPAVQGGELTALLKYLDSVPAPVGLATNAPKPSGLVAAGDALFHQNCAFCHGRDAMGGESGPDLTQSKIVVGDKTGAQMAAVVREGRPENKMPAFNFSSEEMSGLIAFIHARVEAAAAHPGGRRGVVVADLQTGNVDAGKAYFNGAGGCAKCHSATGDLAGVATRYQGLQLEERMLYPRGARSKVTVTTENGEKISGTLAYRDEFTVALRDPKGTYRSWRTDRVKFTVDSPVEAHVDQFPRYTDNDVHNLMAYLQTLKSKEQGTGNKGQKDADE
jgi:mono/diheme cytochrome c family protein